MVILPRSLPSFRNRFFFGLAGQLVKKLILEGLEGGVFAMANGKAFIM